MFGNSKAFFDNKSLDGVIFSKVSNISCFINYKINVEKKKCKFKIFCRSRPGYIYMTLNDINLKTFDVKKEFSMLKLSI